MSSSGLRDRRQRHDRFFERARSESFAARSVYKLQQLDERFKLLRSGMRVLDLGCRPGSWLQYAAQKVGPSGAVVGLDREPLESTLAAHVRVVVGDVLTIDAATLRGELPCFQLVLSDMAPDTSGVAFSDQVRSGELFLRALELARQLGCPGGAFAGKLLMGESFASALAQLRQCYERTKTVRVEATRKGSAEVYLVGQGKR